MDPFDMEVFDEGDALQPVIRMTFALAIYRFAPKFAPPRPPDDSMSYDTRVRDCLTSWDPAGCSSATWTSDWPNASP